MKLSGWGRFPSATCEVAAPRSEADILKHVRSGKVIARGAGRAYGDSSLGDSLTLDMQRFNHMLAFDQQTGQLTAQAGVSLASIIETFLPRGWFPSVTPGTKFVTLGGMIAADVHGKNHHKEGACSAYVDWIDVMTPDGSIHRCSRKDHSGLFEWTIGGMGLTGVILRAAIRLRPVETGWIRQRTIPAANLAAAIEIFEQNLDWTYSVAWIDCLSGGEALGRSLIYLGEHASVTELSEDQRASPFATPRKRKLKIPLDAPDFALNGLSVRAFNAVYFRAGGSRTGDALTDWDTYFYPLDGILDWNRIYGHRGFMQFQCVLPMDSAAAGMTALLQAVSKAGQGSFLAVLKRFGPQTSRYSFPMEGYTLALDFPVNRRSFNLLTALDGITLEHGGRFYLAKDARLDAQTLEEADARTAEFRAMRASAGAASAFSSLQSKRLKL